MAEWLSIDFETRSTVDLRKTGVYPYAQDPTTDVWCAAYAFDDGPIEVWQPGEPVPAAVVEHVQSGSKIRAWNAQFERVIWWSILVPRHGWPRPALEQIWCTAAQGAAMALPRALENAARALGLPVQKDMQGHGLMMRMARPRRTESDGTAVWWDDADRINRLVEYCRRDVEVERAIADRLRPLERTERAVYLLDQQINDRGVQIDLELVDACLSVIARSRATLNNRLETVTGGAVVGATKVGQLTEWLRNQLDDVEKVDKAAVIEMLERPELPAAVREALEIRQEAGKSSTAKLESMRRVACRDGRARGLLLYHGASTGRWAGKLIQPQNFPRASVDDVDHAIDAMLTGDPQLVDLLIGPPFETASALLRPCLVARDGHRLISVDYSNIEGRVTAWLAGETWKIQAFRAFDKGLGPDLYKLAYSRSFNMPVEAVDKDQRQVGKVMELALGFGGGVGAFQSMARGYGLEVEDDEADRLKVAWRDAHPCTVALWRDLERAAFEAVERPGLITEAAGGRIRFRVRAGFLWMILPSGRPLAYAKPYLREVETPWGEMRPQVHYIGVNATTHQWQREAAYGGKWCLSADTLVLTEIGWLPIEDVKADTRVWDGVEWVEHEGAVYRGARNTINLNGVRLTEDHEVLTTAGWKHASSCEGSNWEKVSLPDCAEIRWNRQKEIDLVDTLWLRQRVHNASRRVSKRKTKILRLSAGAGSRSSNADTRADQPPRLRRLAVHARSMPATITSSLAQLWGSWCDSLRSLAKELCSLLEGHGRLLFSGAHIGQNQRQRQLLPEKLPLGDAKAARPEQTSQRAHRHALGRDYCGRSGRTVGCRSDNYPLPFECRLADRTITRSPGLREPTFDILNAGPRRRFTVLADCGPVLVHNCENAVQSIARDLLVSAMLRLDRAGYPIVLSVHDEAVCEVPEDFGSLDEVREIMCASPDWAAGCPVTADGWEGRRYRK